MFIFPGNCYIFEAGEAVQVQTIQKHQFAKLEIFTNFATLTNNFATLKNFFARVTEFSQPSQIFSQGLQNYATLIICTSSQPPFSFAYLISKALQTYASLKANSIFGILAFRSQDLQICTPVFLSSTSFTHRHPNSINRPPPPLSLYTCTHFFSSSYPIETPPHLLWSHGRNQRKAQHFLSAPSEALIPSPDNTTSASPYRPYQAC